jgi:hypothetical protein
VRRIGPTRQPFAARASAFTDEQKDMIAGWFEQGEVARAVESDLLNRRR